jgi:hypothetical protein
MDNLIFEIGKKYNAVQQVNILALEKYKEEPIFYNNIEYLGEEIENEDVLLLKFYHNGRVICFDKSTVNNGVPNGFEINYKITR